MPALTDAMKREIVLRFARFEDNAEIRAAIKQDYGQEVSPQQVNYYNPDAAGTHLSKRLRQLFDEHRERYLRDSSNTFVAYRSARLKELQKLYRLALKRGAIKIAADILKQSAEEQGGMFKNKSIPQPAAPPAPLRIEEETDDERKAREAAAAASYDRQRRGDLTEDDAA